MLWIVFWVAISFFAIIGLMECLLFLLELIALRNMSIVQGATLRVSLKGMVENVEYLLNTLVLMAERVDLGPQDIVLEIIDDGIESKTAQEIFHYCQKNPWVRFTQRENNDII